MSANTKTYAVTGASGKIGRRVAAGLLAAGHKVRVLSRDLAHIEDLVAKGAEAQIGAADDAAYLAAAFKGVDAVFAMIPPNFGAADYRAYQNQVGAAQAQAFKTSGVRKVVNLSSNGAQHAQGTGVVLGLHDQEVRLAAIAGLNVLNLRPTYFMENLFFTLDLIKTQGLVGSPLRADAKLTMIATADIAEVATARLLALDFLGQTAVELLGTRDLTMADVTGVLSAAADKALTYVQFPYEAAGPAMVAAGLTPDSARAMVDLYRSMNDGLMESSQGRSAKTTTATSIEAFAKGFAAAIG